MSCVSLVSVLQQLHNALVCRFMISSRIHTLKASPTFALHSFRPTCDLQPPLWPSPAFLSSVSSCSNSARVRKPACRCNIFAQSRRACSTSSAILHGSERIVHATWKYRRNVRPCGVSWPRSSSVFHSRSCHSWFEAWSSCRIFSHASNFSHPCEM